MSDDISGEWLSAKGKNVPRHQVKKEKKRPVKIKAAVLKKDRLPSVHVSFSNTPPTPSTLIALQRKKQSKLDLFFKPVQQNQEKTVLCLNQDFPKYRQIKRARKPSKECHDSVEQIYQGSCIESKDNRAYEELEGNNNLDGEKNIYDDKIIGVEMIADETFSCESSSSEDDVDFSPIIHVNSQARCRISPQLKRRRISHDSENTLSGLNSPLKIEITNSCKLDPGIKDDKKCQPFIKRSCVVDRKTDSDYHERSYRAGSTSDIFTSQELSEIPPFTFNQITRVPCDKSVGLNTVIQGKKEVTPVQQGKSDFHNELNWLTFTGVESESLGFTQWVQRQGERCKKIQRDVRSVESQDLVIDNQSNTARSRGGTGYYNFFNE